MWTLPLVSVRRLSTLSQSKRSKVLLRLAVLSASNEMFLELEFVDL